MEKFINLYITELNSEEKAIINNIIGEENSKNPYYVHIIGTDGKFYYIQDYQKIPLNNKPIKQLSSFDEVKDYIMIETLLGKYQIDAAIQILKNSGIDLKQISDVLLRYACVLDSTKLAEIALEDKYLDLSPNSGLFGFAATENALEVVKLLLKDKRVDPTEYENSALKMADQYYFAEMVKLIASDIRVRETLSDEQIAKIDEFGSLY